MADIEKLIQANQHSEAYAQKKAYECSKARDFKSEQCDPDYLGVEGKKQDYSLPDAFEDQIHELNIRTFLAQRKARSIGN